MISKIYPTVPTGVDDTSYADIDDEADEIHADLQSVHDFSELGL